MGARIQGLGSPTLEIEGVQTLQPIRFHNVPDRIELGTFMIAAAICAVPGCPIRITHAIPEHLGDRFIEAFRKTGAGLRLGG